MWRLACAIVVVAPTVASAGEVSWTAPGECPDRAALQAAIEHRLDAPFESVVLSADVNVELQVDRYIAHLAIDGRAEESRVLESGDCAELTDAVALVIARLAIAAIPRSAAATAADQPAPPARSAWSGGVRVAGLVGTGTAPGLGVAGEVGGWLAWRSWTIALAGSQWAKGSAMLAGTMSGVDIDVRAASLRIGWRPEARPLRGWVVARLGEIRGQPVGIDGGRGGTARWSAAGVGAGWSVAIAPRVAALAAAEGEFLLDHARFSLDNGTELYHTPTVALHASLAIEVGWR